MKVVKISKAFVLKCCPNAMACIVFWPLSSFVPFRFSVCFPIPGPQWEHVSRQNPILELG